MAYVIILICVLLFGFVVIFGAPYLPTLNKQIHTALKLLDLKPGQTLLELGSGDGRVAKIAAKNGIHVIGYEINPLLVLAAKINTWKYRNLVSIKWRNYWRGGWPKADGIYVFLLDKYMDKLDKIIIQTYKGKKVKLASFTFRVPNRKEDKNLHGVYLYKYK